ncbi:hypothetical protein ACFRQM_48665 [Streptomyces sp. NPDC056831]
MNASSTSSAFSAAALSLAGQAALTSGGAAGPRRPYETWSGR